MCGIVGYSGKRECSDVLIDALGRLEYRGYDSAGVAVMDSGVMRRVRVAGRLNHLKDSLEAERPRGSIGVGHTRWATHGPPTEGNAHPHLSGDLALVHNGIVENHRELRQMLKERGYVFTSQTDTEVIPHLISDYLMQGCDLEEALLRSLDQIEGSYAVALICLRQPDMIFAARKGSPLVVGLGEDENFVASDVPALLSYTRRFIYLEDGDVAVVEPSKVRIVNSQTGSVQREAKEVSWSADMAELGAYRHFMEKEIYEQPLAVARTMERGIDPITGGISAELAEKAALIAERCDRFHIPACGTSLHAGMIARYWLENIARVPTVVEAASEYRYRNPVIDRRTCAISISQSGETADTLAAMGCAKLGEAMTVSLTNVRGSSIDRGAEINFLTQAGPEIGVASTKAFTTQLASLYLFAVALARARKSIDDASAGQLIRNLSAVPALMKSVLEGANRAREAAEMISAFPNVYYLGRGPLYPMALEGALKLKEISYIHAEGLSAGEMKHGPIALIDERLLVVGLMPDCDVFGKMAGNIEEVRARQGTVLGLVTEGNGSAEALCNFSIKLPQAHGDLLPLLTAIPLQLIAYHSALIRGADVDKPRNLAKSVTVE